MAPKPLRLDALTGLRFVAAAAVVLYHLRAALPGQFDLPAEFAARLPLAPAAVTFFFVLSGFILTYVHPRPEELGAGGRFLLARFIRLWPAHLVGLLLCMAVGGVRLSNHPGPVYSLPAAVGCQLAMAHSWYPALNLVSQFNGASWSVSTEFGFYLLYLPLVWNWSQTWWWKLPLTLVPPALTLVASARGWVPYGEYGLSPWGGPFVNFSPLARVYQFAVGIAAARLWLRAGDGRRLGVTAATALEGLAVAGLVAALYACGPVADAVRPVAGIGLPASDLLNTGGMLLTLPSALLILALAGGRGLMARALALRPLVFLGDISYGVYILHWALLTFCALHPEMLRLVSGWVALAGFWAVLLLLSYCTDVFVERPARRRVLGRWPADNRPARAVGRWLLTPQARPAVAGLVLAVAVGGVWCSAQRRYQVIDAGMADRLVAESVPSSRWVQFGDAYRLRGATFSPARNGVELQLVWESLKHQPPAFEAWVIHAGATPAEEALRVVHDRPDTGRDWLPTGRLWVQRVFVPFPPPPGTTQLVLTVPNRDVDKLLPAQNGPRDAFGRLILFPEPAPPCRSAETISAADR